MTRSLTDTAPEATTQTNAPATDALAGFHGLVGRSAPMQALFERIRRVAPYDVPVLIVGETGTGKTRVARVLHELSWRRAGPFAVLSCGALPPDLLRRGLDAQEPGSSWRRTRGDAKLLDGLRGGTLLLDELGDLAPDVQAQLGQVAAGLARLPAGSDVRLVATTHQDCLRPSARVASARISTTSCAAPSWSCRRCGSGSRTCRSWSSMSGGRPMSVTGLRSTA